LGGTTRGGQNGLDCAALRLITPPNGAGAGGRYRPSIVLVAFGAPGATLVGAALASAGLSAAAARRGDANATATMRQQTITPLLSAMGACRSEIVILCPHRFIGL
jgi:hypothetical protein